MKITLAVRNQGHIPSFKNKKRSNRKGQVFTEPKTKKWMESCIQSFESQLFCISRTTEKEMLTGCSPRLTIASLQQLEGFDDSWQWMPEINIRVERVERGQEGASIVLESI